MWVGASGDGEGGGVCFVGLPGQCWEAHALEEVPAEIERAMGCEQEHSTDPTATIMHGEDMVQKMVDEAMRNAQAALEEAEMAAAEAEACAMEVEMLLDNLGISLARPS